jgi:hypothetical protein
MMFNDEAWLPTNPIDASRPQPARVWNFWLGGKDNLKMDRDFADEITRAFPSMPAAAKANRAVLGRAIEYLTDAGIRQFIDVGAGLPNQENTHQVAQRLNPAARIVYVDNDLMAVAHARALLATSGTAEGKVGVVEGNLRRPETILDADELTRTLDLKQPVAIILVMILHLLDDDAAINAVRSLVRRAASGSFVVISHATRDFFPPETDIPERVETIVSDARYPFRYRSKREVGAYVEGMQMIEPGVVSVGAWRNPDPEPLPAAQTASYVVVARKPSLRISESR